MTAEELAEKLPLPADWTPEARRAHVERLIAEGLPHRRDEEGVRQFTPRVVRDWLVEQQKAVVAPRPVVVEKAVDAAKHLGVTTRTLQDWKKEGMPWQPGAYDIREIEAWREQRFGASREKDEIQERGAAETRHAIAKANKAELEYLELAGKLVQVDSPRRVLVQTVHAIRTHIEQLPERLREAVELDKAGKDECQRKAAVVIEGMLRAIQQQLRAAGEELADDPSQDDQDE